MALIKLIAEHLIPSALIGFTAYWLTGQGHLITIALLTGWLIDSDHLLDFFMAKWRGKIVDKQVLKAVPILRAVEKLSYSYILMN
jgi:hypothetical protein